MNRKRLLCLRAGMLRIARKPSRPVVPAAALRSAFRTAVGLALFTTSCLPTYSSAGPTGSDDGGAADGGAHVGSGNKDASQDSPVKTDPGSRPGPEAGGAGPFDARSGDPDTPPPTCTTDAECTSAGATRHCGPKGHCVECAPETVPCAPGLYCTEGGRCALGCSESSDCVRKTTPTDDGGEVSLPALTCSSHTCEGCTKDEDCPPGTICDGTAQCVSGCGPGRACPAGWLCCQNQCIGLSSTQRGCTVCPSLCSNGHGDTECAEDVCKPTCAEGFGDCDGDPNNGCESSLDTPAHCHSCTTSCKNDQGTTTCTASGCQPTCRAGYQSCDTDPNNGCETEVNANPNNCKTCGHQCAFAHAVAGCGGGECTIERCADGFRDCDGRSENGCEVDINTDPLHCGTCDQACTNAHGTTTCVNGQCAPKCLDGYGDCDGLITNGCETNLKTNTLHCSVCGHACPAYSGEPNCVAGVCGVSNCNPGLGDCDRDGTCETTLSTVNDCGRCGNTCPSLHGTPSCQAALGDAGAATCSIVCTGEWRDCNPQVAGCETSIHKPDNCGACGVPCSRPHMYTTCATGTCEPVSTGLLCEPGYNDCDGIAENGCESEAKKDINNCGTCGTKCNAGHGATSCVNGACVPVCETNWSVCQGDVKDGCQFDTTSVQSCGSSCTACLGTDPFCIAGECKRYVDIDADTTATTGTATGKALTIQQHPLSGNPQRVVVVALAMSGNKLDTANPAITYNGVAMTQATSAWSINQAWAGLYYIKHASLPAAGKYNVMINATAYDVAGITGAVKEFWNVDQANTVDKVLSRVRGPCSTNGGPTDTITIGSPNAWTIDAVALQAGSVVPTPSTPQEKLFATNLSGVAAAGSLLRLSGASAGSSVTMGHTDSSGRALTCNASAHVMMALARGMQ